MKFKEGQYLYYVNPFCFTIEKILTKMIVAEHDGLYYIDNVGAYLKEEDLFLDLEEAKKDALNKLNKFMLKATLEIKNCNPEFDPNAY